MAGIIVFGSLMGVAFINQQYLQNVLGYDTLQAGAAILPAVVFMVLVAPRSAKLVHERGSRATLLLGQAILALAFIGMLLLWGEGTNYLFVAIPLALMGIGVGLAGTPSSNSLTGSVPVRRVGMASGTADLQRDLGGALMTSIFGALLTAGYAAAMGSAIAASGQDITATTQSELQLSYASAADLAAQYPQYADQIIGRGPVIVPRRRPARLHGGPRCGGPRHRADVPGLPEEGGRAATAGRVPGRGRGADRRSRAGAGTRRPPPAPQPS